MDKFAYRTLLSLLFSYVAVTPLQAVSADGPKLVEQFTLPATSSEVGYIHGLQSDGDTLAVGYSISSTGKGRGWVLILVRTEQGWVEQARIQPLSDCQYCIDFGQKIALSGDTLVVGSRNEGRLANGAAYAYQRIDGVWTFQARWEPSPQQDSLVGKAVATNGEYALIGASNVDVGTFPRHIAQGVVYVYKYTGASWHAEDELHPSSPREVKDFGRTLAMTKDTAVIGTYGGAIFVFRLHKGRWKQEARLDLQEGPSIGDDVDVSGETLVATTHVAPLPRALLYNRVGSTWSRAATLQKTAESSGFGYNAKLHGAFVALPEPFQSKGLGRVVLLRQLRDGAVQSWDIDPPAESESKYFGQAFTWFADQLIVVNSAGKGFIYSVSHLTGAQ